MTDKSLAAVNLIREPIDVHPALSGSGCITGIEKALGFGQHHLAALLVIEKMGHGEIEQFLSIVGDPGNRPVYMHCTLGIDRTGVMAGIYRIEHDGWDNDEAVAEMEYFGHNELWIDLEEFLKDYGRAAPD